MEHYATAPCAHKECVIGEAGEVEIFPSYKFQSTRILQRWSSFHLWTQKHFSSLQGEKVAAIKPLGKFTFQNSFSL